MFNVGAIVMTCIPGVGNPHAEPPQILRGKQLSRAMLLVIVSLHGRRGHVWLRGCRAGERKGLRSSGVAIEFADRLAFLFCASWGVSLASAMAACAPRSSMSSDGDEEGRDLAGLMDDESMFSTVLGMGLSDMAMLWPPITV